MGNSLPKDDDTLEVATKTKDFYRRNSKKLGKIAEDAVLPKHKRTFKTKPSVESIALNVECEGQPTVAKTYTSEELQGQGQPRVSKAFPMFIVMISFTQVMLYYFGELNLWTKFAYDPQRRHELWRYLTIMFIHHSEYHLWMNIVVQLLLGGLLEIVHHGTRTAIIYLASILGGTMFITIFDPRHYGSGASAGVCGLIMAHLATIILNWRHMNWKFCRMFWLLLYIAQEIGVNCYFLFVLNEDPKVSHAGHIGGAVIGFLTSVFVLKIFDKKTWELKAQKICAKILVAVLIIIVVANIILTFTTNFYVETLYHTNYTQSVLKSNQSLDQEDDYYEYPNLESHEKNETYVMV